MQVTNISLYSFRCYANAYRNGFRGAAYTVRPGFSNGLLLTVRREPMSGYIGFSSQKFSAPLE